APLRAAGDPAPGRGGGCLPGPRPPGPGTLSGGGPAGPVPGTLGDRARVPAGHGGLFAPPADGQRAAGDAAPTVVLPAVLSDGPGDRWVCGGRTGISGGGDLDGVVVRGCDQAIGGTERVGGGGSGGRTAAGGRFGRGAAAALAPAVGWGVERRL